MIDMDNRLVRTSKFLSLVSSRKSPSRTVSRFGISPALANLSAITSSSRVNHLTVSSGGDCPVIAAAANCSMCTLTDSAVRRAPPCQTDSAALAIAEAELNCFTPVGLFDDAGHLECSLGSGNAALSVVGRAAVFVVGRPVAGVTSTEEENSGRRCHDQRPQRAENGKLPPAQ